MKRNMKKLLVFALALMPSLSISVMAQSSGDDPEVIPVIKTPIPTPEGPRLIPDEPIPIPLKPIPPVPGPSHEPRFRNSVQEPYCYFQDGVVYIDADATITAITATVTRYADNQVWSNTTNSNSLSITVSYSPGEYYLELTLSDGQYYQGKYIIE